MIIYQWLSQYLLLIAALYWLMLIIVFSLFAARIGHIKTLDELLPEDEKR